MSTGRWRARRRVSIRNVVTARNWLPLLLPLLFLRTTHSGENRRESSRAGAEVDAGAFLGLTNELAIRTRTDSEGNGTADGPDEPLLLNMTAFEVLSDPVLTAPYHEELSTMWSALQFLCQTFDGRQLDGCDQILALPSPGSASVAANLTAETLRDRQKRRPLHGSGGGSGALVASEADLTRFNLTVDTGDDDDDDYRGGHGGGIFDARSGGAAAGGSSPLHAATLFRFLRAQPFGFGNMKVTLGAEPREPLAAEAEDGQFLLRQARVAPPCCRLFVGGLFFFFFFFFVLRVLFPFVGTEPLARLLALLLLWGRWMSVVAASRTTMFIFGGGS
jgi:hypothetical protein